MNNQHGGPKVTSLPTVKPEQPASEVVPSSLVSAVRAELELAGRLDSAIGQQALFLAERLSAASFDNVIAALNKELRETMGRALDGVKVADDPLDEVARRRDAKRLSS